jgi:peptidoglycan/LPS O-acetylase OafA/YrhL
MRAKAGYIPTLDGWRALAIISVFFGHIHMLDLPGRIGHRLAISLWFSGGRGVDIFFAISGLLICSRLLDEEVRFGHISLKNFYIRRAFRILPPAVIFLLVLGLLHLYGPIPLSPLDWFSSLFFFRNYTVTLTGPPLAWWFTSHFWSLSVEEQFYLFLPALLVLLPRWRMRALLTIALLSIAWKVYVIRFLHLDGLTLYIWLHYHTGGCIDSLLIPAAIAVSMRQTETKRLLSRWLTSKVWLFLLVPVAAWLFYRTSPWPSAKLAAPLLILTTVYNPKSLVGLFLESAPLRWIGRLSYSLYLWQGLFLCTRYPVQTPLGRLQMFPYNMVCLLACACLSYYLVELPMIRVGHSLTRSSYVPPGAGAVPAIPSSSQSVESSPGLEGKDSTVSAGQPSRRAKTV